VRGERPEPGFRRPALVRITRCFRAYFLGDLCMGWQPGLGSLGSHLLPGGTSDLPPALLLALLAALPPAALFSVNLAPADSAAPMMSRPVLFPAPPDFLASLPPCSAASAADDRSAALRATAAIATEGLRMGHLVG
jgi:hypothetical protein